MSTPPFDLFVIGAGSGGVRAARMAAQRGARVAVAEMAALGGTCVNLGCIPKKLYSYAAHYADAFEESRGFGWRFDAPPVFDWAQLKTQRAREISRLNGIYDDLLRRHGVALFHGRAQLTGPQEVTVGGVAHTAHNVLIATGGHSLWPVFPGAEWAVTSDAMFDLPRFPQRLLVVGGGYIACEMASIFAGLGAQVTQLVRGTAVLTGFDQEVAAFAAAQMRQHGVAQRFDTTVSAIERSADGMLHVTLASGEVLPANTVLHATGRGPNTAGLGLAEVGVELDKRGAIPVNANYQTCVHSIHAVGDVTDRLQLTPVALAEAMALVDHLFGSAAGHPPRQVDYDLIPTAVFTHPNIGTVGWSEAQARERCNGGVRIFRSEFRPLRHTLSGSSERCLIKLVVDAASDRVVGLHMVGPDAGEVVQGFAVALRAGATKAVFDTTLGIHPTLAEEFVTLREAS